MEALAQTAGVLELSKPWKQRKTGARWYGQVKFKKQVVPGDQLVTWAATFVKRRGTITVDWNPKAEVDGKACG